MNIEKSMVQKILITGLKRLDPISVYLEDFGGGRGKLIITGFGEAWSYFWGAMGDGYTLSSFIVKCDTDYLAGKLGNGLQSKIDDYEAIAEKARKYICERRRFGHFISKEKARELFDKCDRFEGIDNPVELDQDLMYDVFGDDWCFDIPQKRNPKFDYLCEIINVVKEALATNETKAAA